MRLPGLALLKDEKVAVGKMGVKNLNKVKSFASLQKSYARPIFGSVLQEMKIIITL